MCKQPIRVWIYARTADARPGVLENQLAELCWEAERRGYHMAGNSAERCGAGALNRPALFAMLEAVRRGQVDAVMITRLSRFSYHRLAVYLILCFLSCAFCRNMAWRSSRRNMTCGTFYIFVGLSRHFWHAPSNAISPFLGKRK